MSASFPTKSLTSFITTLIHSVSMTVKDMWRLYLSAVRVLVGVLYILRTGSLNVSVQTKPHWHLMGAAAMKVRPKNLCFPFLITFLFNFWYNHCQKLVYNTKTNCIVYIKL